MPRDHLFVSDVDHTLLGDDEALAAFAEWYADARRFLRLAYNSGRFYDSVLASVRETGLPQPDAIIGGVGTQICFPPGGEPLNDWPRTGAGWDPDVIRRIASHHAELEPQPDHLQSRYKISFFGHDLCESFFAQLRRELDNAQQDATVVYSSHRDLDVLPAGANKGTAVAHLAQHWRIEPTHVIVAGDSGNDLAMFRQGFRGIVVGNAHPELKSLRDPLTFHASHDHAAGVLEGLQHWLGGEHRFSGADG